MIYDENTALKAKNKKFLAEKNEKNFLSKMWKVVHRQRMHALI